MPFSLANKSGKKSLYVKIDRIKIVKKIQYVYTHTRARARRNKVVGHFTVGYKAREIQYLFALFEKKLDYYL